MKFLGNGAVFATIYLLFMIPTYALPYFGSNSTVLNTTTSVGGFGLSPAAWAHLACLAVLIIITWFRGVHVKAQWLVILPIIAAVFEFAPGLNLIPFVPTVMHIFVLIKGASLSPDKGA